MANKLYEETSVQAIATAIRGKNGSSDTYTISQMAPAIDALETGGGFYPSLLVSAATGSTVTATNGTDTVTLTEIESGKYWGEVTDYGEWTVTVNGTTLKTFDIDRVMQYAPTMPDGATLDDCSWENIRAISQEGTAASFWSVGDTKAVELKGTCGTLELDTTLYCYIIGFDHNSDKEGKGIHFGTWKDSSGKDLCLIDSYFNQYQSYDGTKYFQMNHRNSGNYGSNYGGWAASDARYDILGSTNAAPSGYGSDKMTSATGNNPTSTCATNPVANTLMSCLPAALRAVMKPMTKYTDNYGNSSNVADHVTATIDYLPLLAEFEIYGARSYANEYEKNYQAQYEYFANSNSKIKYRHSSTGSIALWWERSPFASNDHNFCYVDTPGNATCSFASISSGLAPIFLV